SRSSRGTIATVPSLAAWRRIMIAAARPKKGTGPLDLASDQVAITRPRGPVPFFGRSVALNLLLLLAVAAPGQVVQPPNPEQPGVPPSQERAILRDHRDAVTSLAVSQDGKTLATASGGKDHPGEIKLWDLVTLQERRTLRGHPAPVLSVCIAPDNQTLASGAADGTVKRWNAVTGAELASLKGHQGRVC